METGRASPDECPFCAIVDGRAPASVVRRWPDSLAIVPLSPVTAGHTLIIPKTHVADIGVDPAVSAATMRRAAELAAEFGACNIITSRGELATQSVFHLHLHLLPRRRQDGLPLPWAPEPNRQDSAEPPSVSAISHWIKREYYYGGAGV
ncbi:HIT family protein [Streptomyces sp. NPDC096057]|uniref:HIT family protein n=1 Tax=Streptomyces sp. NPDC096057 TaxID=3155543 RepID=UPI00331EBDF5